MKSFDDSLHASFFRNAQYFAADLFYESFAIPFPVPRENAGLSIPTPPENWWQEVAFYKWSESHLEPVGFCNWIRYADCYLCGGMCVRNDFYRRLPREHWLVCRERGGVAQIMLETAFRELTDCVAWFGYCGDKKAYIVDIRAGYRPTRHPCVIVKWNADIADAQRRELEDRIASIGPF
ncbi:MAG: hypothetical protein AUH79_05780 [Betaproteobacteria bacterium 13_1_40CM_4_64_4]|nr:MAG: hypothetical protein AUH79_05780 [Betaproteobacteria bacterium 13_1_40CM_4_64_4]